MPSAIGGVDVQLPKVVPSVGEEKKTNFVYDDILYAYQPSCHAFQSTDLGCDDSDAAKSLSMIKKSHSAILNRSAFSAENPWFFVLVLPELSLNHTSR